MTDIGTTTDSINQGAAVVGSGSSIADLSYRNYDGPLKTRFLRWWVIAQSQLRLTWSRSWFYILAGLPLLRFLLGGFRMYLSSIFAAQIGQSTPNFIGEPEGQKYALQFWSVLCGDTNSTMALIITLVIGAGCIAADNQANALLVYFSKPIAKLDYLVGKWVSVFLTLFVITLFPATVLYVFAVVSFRDDGFLTSEPWLGPRLLLSIFVPALIHSSLIVGISAWSKSPRIVGALYAGFYILGGIVAGVIAGIVFKNNPEMQNLVRHCSLLGLINGIAQNIMHVVVPAPLYFMRPMREPDVTNIPKLWPLLTIAGTLIAVSLTAAWVKIRAVEVVRG
jgi:ABC-2 type transport system permease protein